MIDALTDKENYINFLKSIGLEEFTEIDVLGRVKNNINSVYNIPTNRYFILNNDVYLGRGKNGCIGFYSWLEFDINGKYISHGAAE